MDLNGHTVSSRGQDGPTVSTIEVSGNLNLEDKSQSKSGAINGIGEGVHVYGNFTFDSGKITSHGSSAVINEGTFNMTGGLITDCNWSGVTTRGSGNVFNMYGGKISDITSDGNGGGVSVSSGTFNMYGGEISGNGGVANGGGVCVSGGIFNMYGGKIIKNNARKIGGGVYVGDGTFTMEGGRISGNQALALANYNGNGGGGVYVYGPKAKFTITGGTITGNSLISSGSSRVGGGVYANSSTFNIQGSPIISGNVLNGTYDEEEGIYTGDTADNVYLFTGKYITITGALTGEAGSIGISMETPGVFTNTAYENLSCNDASKFFSDKTAYTAGRNGGGQLYLGTPVYISSGISTNNKPYDGTTAASFRGTTVMREVSSGTQVFGLEASEITGTFADKNVGENKSVSITGALLSNESYVLDLSRTNSVLNLKASITVKPVTVTGVMGVIRAYETGNLTVALTGGTISSGVLDGDNVFVDLSAAAGTMADADIGTDKPVTVSGVNLGGTDAGNYELSAQPSDVTVTISADGTVPSGNAALRLPSGLKEVQASAFEGSPSFDEVYLPDGMETISGRAFADCSGLKLVHIPDSVTSIADGAFAGSLHVIFSCTSDTCAAYARDHYIMRQNP